MRDKSLNVVVGDGDNPQGWADHPVNWRKRLPWIALLPAGILLQQLAAALPGVVESVYSRGLYVVVGSILGFFTSWAPFSLAEFGALGLIIWLVVILVGAVFRLYEKSRTLKNLCHHGLANSLALAGLFYAAFLLLWGLNFNRETFARATGLAIRNASVEELAKLNLALIAEANDQREILSEDEMGVMMLPKSIGETCEKANKGFVIAGSEEYPTLAGWFGTPKPVLFSGMLTTFGISGIFSPFTGEPNVNGSLPEPHIPFIASHELAHQRGYSREDEANFIGFVTCRMHPDIEFRYSGNLGALLHSLPALYRADRGRAEQVAGTMADGVRRDLQSYSRFWRESETFFNRLTRDVGHTLNNTYLKMHGQEGVQSYGRMVDLLLADFRKQKREQKTGFPK